MFKITKAIQQMTATTKYEQYNKNRFPDLVWTYLKKSASALIIIDELHQKSTFNNNNHILKQFPFTFLHTVPAYSPL